MKPIRKQEMNQNLVTMMKMMPDQLSSSVSISSDESYDSFIEVADVYLEHKQDLRKNLQHLQQSQPINENYYSDMVRLISDESVGLCEEIISIQPNFIGNGAKLAREITGSNSFGMFLIKLNQC